LYIHTFFATGFSWSAAVLGPSKSRI